MKNSSLIHLPKLKHVQILNKFYRDLISTHDYKKVANLAATALKKYSNSPSVAIFQHLVDKKELLLIASNGFNNNVKQASKNFPVSKSFTGIVVKSKGLLILKNITADKRVHPSAKEALTKAGFKSLISLPLLYNNNVIGAANLIFRDVDGIRDIDRETLTTIGKTIAMAMVNATYVNNIKKEIVKRTAAEEKLSVSQNKYRTLVENINDMVVKFDTAGTLHYVSPNYRKVFNVKNKDVIGKKYLPQIHPDDLPKVNRLLKRALRTPYVLEHEERMLTKSGWRWIQWSNRGIINNSSKLREIIAIGRDITEKKEAELELIKSQDNIKSILEVIPDVLFRVNKDGVYTDYIAHEKSPLRIPKQLVINHNISEILPPELYKTAKDKIRKVINTGISETMEYSMKHKKSMRHFESRLIKNNPEEVLVIVRDITNIENYRKEISKLALIARETDNGVIITDRNHCIEWVNEGFTRITGYTLQEIQNKRPGDFLLGKDSDPVIANKFLESLHGGKSIRAELINYHKDGNKFWVELNAQPVLDKQGKIKQFIYMQNVTTQRKEYELMLKEKQERLSELTKHLIAMRESERADIARGIHDELGQIVAAVKMNITFLINGITDPENTLSQIELLEELKSMSKMIDKSVISIRRIIKNLRPETLDKLGLVSAIKQLLEDFKDLTKINYRFNKNFTELNMAGDKAIAAYRTVQESLTNIIKHSNATKVAVVLKFDNDSMELKIVDNGRGIREGDLQKSQSFGLLGMRQRIEGLGGSFKVFGKPGGGTSLNIKLPVDQRN